MMYREYLVMRKALAWFVATLVAITLIGMLSGTITIRSGDDLLGVGDASGWLAAIFGSIFGVALGNGSRGPSRVLWVLPVQRWKLAVQVIAVDIAGTTAAFVCAYAVIVLSLEAVGMHFRAGAPPPIGLENTAMALATAYAAYGWSALVGMLGRRMAYCGIIALPALIMWTALAQSWVALAPVLRAAIVVNPFVVFTAGQTLRFWSRHPVHLDPVTSSLAWLGTTWETPVLIATAVATCGLAVVLWQRSEVLSA